MFKPQKQSVLRLEWFCVVCTVMKMKRCVCMWSQVTGSGANRGCCGGCWSWRRWEEAVKLVTSTPAATAAVQQWFKHSELHRHRLTLVSSYQRPEDGRGHAPSGKSSGRLDQEVEATPADILRFTMATEAVVSVGTNTEEGEENSELSERLGQLEKEKAELQELLSNKEWVNGNMTTFNRC